MRVAPAARTYGSHFGHFSRCARTSSVAFAASRGVFDINWPPPNACTFFRLPIASRGACTELGSPLGELPSDVARLAAPACEQAVEPVREPADHDEQKCNLQSVCEHGESDGHSEEAAHERHDVWEREHAVRHAASVSTASSAASVRIVT